MLDVVITLSSPIPFGPTHAHTDISDTALDTLCLIITFALISSRLMPTPKMMLNAKTKILIPRYTHTKHANVINETETKR
jgi:hypothetical protein